MSEHRLGEVTIERPRSGMRISLKKYKGFQKELNKLTEVASEDGLLCPYLIKPRHKTKFFSDCLGPLRRFLRSHVGQPWDDVYSKLCRRLNRNTLLGQHVLTHVWDYIERHVELINDVPHRKAYGRKSRDLTGEDRELFYVHPETGILCLVPRESRQKK